jgi:hydroxypyruvate isomerase
MSVLKFSANLSMLWSSLPLEERLLRAADAGFQAVELWWPGAADAERLPDLTRSAGVQLIALNFDAGDMASGDRGLASDPSRAEQFRRNVPLALEIAGACGCRMLNALLGLRLERHALDEQLGWARESVSWAADQAAAQDATILIEAINVYDNGPYLITDTAGAAAFVHSVGRPNVRLLYDVFHMQRMEGNIVTTLDRHWEEIAHIQVADVPARGEPGTGEINYLFVLDHLAARGYPGHIGLEYRPSTGRPELSFGWMRQLEPIGGDGR